MSTTDLMIDSKIMSDAIIDRIDEKREALKISHDKIGEITKLKRSTITRFFSKKHDTGFTTVVLIAKAVGLNLLELDADEFLSIIDARELKAGQPVKKVNAKTELNDQQISKKAKAAAVKADLLPKVPAAALLPTAKYEQVGKSGVLSKWKEGDVWRVKKYKSGQGFVESFYLSIEEAETESKK